MGLEHLREIRAIVTDVDGVLTDGSIFVTEQGESKTFHVRDGLAIKMCQKAGFVFALLSGRASVPVQIRAAELGIDAVKVGRLDKETAFREIEEEIGIRAEHIAYIGDDLPDLAPLQLAAVALCPEDAVVEVKAVCDYVIPRLGGRGVVRDAIEMILKAQGTWEKTVRAFETQHG